MLLPYTARDIGFFCLDCTAINAPLGLQAGYTVCYILSTMPQTLNFTSPPRLYLPNRPQFSLVHCFHQKPLSVPLSVITEATPLSLVSTFCSLFLWPVSQKEDFYDLKVFRSQYFSGSDCAQGGLNIQRIWAPDFKAYLYSIRVPYWFYFQKVTSWPAQDYLGDNRRHLLDTKDICQISVCKAKWWGHEMHSKRKSPEIFNNKPCFPSLFFKNTWTVLSDIFQKQISKVDITHGIF